MCGWQGFPSTAGKMHIVTRLALLLLLLLHLSLPVAAAPRVLFLGDLQCDPEVAKLDGLRGLIGPHDLVIVNLEGPITKHSYAKQDKQWHLRSTPALTKALAALAPGRVIGIVANNHGFDCGEPGVNDTRAAMKAAGLQTVGDPAWPPRDPVPLFVAATHPPKPSVAGAPSPTLVTERRVIVLAANLVPPTRDAARWPAAARAAWEQRLVAAASQLRDRGDVIVCLHWNPDESLLPPAADRELARRLLGAGVRVVAGFHPHVLGPIEATPEGIVFYSIGNLGLSCPCSQQPQGAAMRVTLGGEAYALPLLCGRLANGLRVSPARCAEAASIRDWLNTISVDFATRVEADGRIKK